MKKLFTKTALILPPIFKGKKSYRAWVIQRRIIAILALLIIIGLYVFFNLGYKFSASNQSYTIHTDYYSIKLKPAFLKKDMILLFCFDVDDALSLEYIESLKNLHNDYGDLKVIALLNKPMQKAKLEHFIHKYELPFLVFNPSDKKHLVKDLYKKMQEEIRKDSSKEDQFDDVKLPFLLLYDRKHKLYQHYQGAVVQEMLMFDIAQAGIKE